MSGYLGFSRLGKKGRLGNQIFEISSVIGLAKKYNRIPVFNEWSYEKYFNGKLTHSDFRGFVDIKEQYFHHHEWTFDETKNYDIDGYLQAEKYFINCKDEIKEFFTFKPEFIEATKNKLPSKIWDKETILFQIRRGDYFQNPCYYQISITYYIDALITHFPNWQDYNIIFFSDELSYCHIHFDCLPNAYFTDGLNDIEQVAIGTLCDHFIIANSSFGWWQTWLGEKPHSKIIHCGHLHSGKLQEKSEPKDYYPERWKRHQKDSYKIDLTDVTFTIPVFYDSIDRKQNLDLCVCMLQNHFDTHISISEQGGTKFEYMSKWARYTRFDNKDFHRTKMLNDMAIEAETPYLANWDADVIIAPMQVYLSVLKLREGADVVFPYDGRFARLPRIPWFKTIEKALDIGIIGDTEPKGKRGKPVPEYSVGGAVFFNKESFIDGGMENEFMISFGPEDCERNDRFTKLGFKIERVCELSSGLGGPLYHIDHWCGPDSTPQNPHFKANHRELEKGRAMSKEELRAYVDSFYWRHKYTEKYYNRISPGSIESAKEVYKELRRMGIWPTTVFDVGCGVGEWAKDNFYYGLDYKIPIKSLTFDQERYINCDLEKEVYEPWTFAPFEKYDLCLCLEVAEHISEGRADVLIEMLCKLSDHVLFSAAIPGQGGTGHINEKWASWWAEKFETNGFYPHKADLRKVLFHNENVEVWYRNNLILYTREKFEIDYELDFVHPKMFASCIQHYKNQLYTAPTIPTL